jgi:uncharacterized protein YdaU (DUF1376 family)
MIDLKDLARPPVLLALAGSAVVGFAAGYLIGRDPQLLRRVLAAAAQGWEQTRLSLAEAREDLADQWAEATESARRDVEAAAFATAAAATSAAEGAEAPAAREEGESAAPGRKPKRSRTSASRRAASRTTH